MTRDVLVLGSDGLILKTTFVLHEGGISLNNYSTRDSPKAFHSKKKKKKKKSVSQKLRHFRVFLKTLHSKVVLFDSDARRVRGTSNS